MAPPWAKSSSPLPGKRGFLSGLALCPGPSWQCGREDGLLKELSRPGYASNESRAVSLHVTSCGLPLATTSWPCHRLWQRARQPRIPSWVCEVRWLVCGGAGLQVSGSRFWKLSRVPSALSLALTGPLPRPPRRWLRNSHTDKRGDFLVPAESRTAGLRTGESPLPRTWLFL